MTSYEPKSEQDFPNLGDVQRVVRSNRTRLPYIVEFSGLPKSGKTTVMRRTLRGLERLGFRCATVPEAATTKIDRSLRTDLFVFNMLCFLENLQSLVREAHRGASIDIVLIDRGVVDSFVWFEFLNRIGLLQDEVREKTEAFASLPTWLSHVNQVIYIKSDWRSYQARFSLDSPIIQNPTLSEEYFDRLASAYEDRLKQSSLGDIELLAIDGGLSKTTKAEQPTGPEVLQENWVIASNASFQIINSILTGIVKDNVEYIATIGKDLYSDDYFSTLEGDSVNKFIDDVFASKMASKVSYIERSTAELDASRLQLVAGAYIVRDGRVMVLRRAKTEKRPQLQNKRSLLVTGHVDKFDASLAGGARNAVENCLFRELKEELTHVDWPEVTPKLVIRIGTDDMGRKHLSIIYEVQSISSALNTSALPGAGDFEANPEFWTTEELVNRADEFDDWSQHVIRTLFSQPAETSCSR